MYYVWKLLYRGLLLLFKVIFSGPLQLTGWKMCFICKCFMWYSHLRKT